MDPALAAQSNSNSLYLSIDKSMLEGDTYTAMMDVKGECNVGNGMLILAGGSDDNVHVAYYRLYGKITAGSPIEAIERPDEYFSLPAYLIPKNKEVFTLNVSVYSMINA